MRVESSILSNLAGYRTCHVYFSNFVSDRSFYHLVKLGLSSSEAQVTPWSSEEASRVPPHRSGPPKCRYFISKSLTLQSNKFDQLHQQVPEDSFFFPPREVAAPSLGLSPRIRYCYRYRYRYPSLPSLSQFCQFDGLGGDDFSPFDYS